MIQLLVIIGGGMTALVVMPMDDDDFFVLGVAGDNIAGSADFSVASLRGSWRIIDHHIMYKPGIEIVKQAKIMWKL